MASTMTNGTTNWQLALEQKNLTLNTKDTYVDKNIEITVADAEFGDVTGGSATNTVSTADTTYTTDTNTGYKVTFTANATIADATIPVSKAGWLSDEDDLTVTGGSASGSLDKYIKAGELQSVAGNAPVATAGLADTTYLTTTNTGYAITATADAAATSKTGVDAVKTAGWVPASGTAANVTVTTPAATQASVTKYIKKGELQSVAGNAPVATAGFSTSDYLTTTNTGFAITATADAAATSKAGVDAVKTAGWVPADGSVTVTTPAATQATKTTYIKAGSLANAGTTGVSYTDASASGPILISGDYLYINEGYQTNKKISLAKLVPDGANINVTDGDKWIYDDKTAYDSDGKLITGTMPKAELSASVTSATASASIASITPAYNSTNKNYDVTGTGSITGTANVSAAVSTSGLAVSTADNGTGGKYVGLGATSATGSGNISGTASLSGVTLAAAELQNVKGTDGAVKPVIKVDTANNNAAIGTLTTTKPSGNYIAVNTSAITASTDVTASVKSNGYADTTNTNKPAVTVTRGAQAATTAYIPLTAATHSDAKVGTASITKAKATASTTVVTKAGDAVPGVLTSAPTTGNYIKIDGTAAQTTAGSLSQGVKCETSVGYVGTAISNTVTVSGNVGVDVTAAASKYIKVYDGSFTVG